MPSVQRGQPYKLGAGRWGLRYYDRDGKRQRTREKFSSKSAAFAHYRNVIEPELRGALPARDGVTLGEFVPIYLERHAANVRPRTIVTLRERLALATRAFGTVPLRELERMSGEVATWQAKLPERSRYGVVQALRQTLGAAVRWGYMTTNPALLAGRNRQPSPRTVRVYSRAELDATTAELSPMYAPIPGFAAATGLRPEEWQALERRDVDRRARMLNVLRTVSDGEVVELAKTSGGRRQVPVSRRALGALDTIPPRLDTPLVFPAPQGGVLNLDNWRRRMWAPAIEAAGVKHRRIYDLRHTYATWSLSAGVDTFTLARRMGTSVKMIDRTYGHLVAGADVYERELLDAFDEAQARPVGRAVDAQEAAHAA